MTAGGLAEITILVAQRERIAKDLPGCKIICSFRDPVERAYSYYRLMANNVWTRDEFADAIISHRDLRESCRYGHYLRKWIGQFGEDNVLPVFIEDLEDDPQALMDRMCDFIRTPRLVLAESPFAKQRVEAMRTSAPRNLKLARQAPKVIGWLKDRRFHRSALALRESAVGRFFFEGERKYRPRRAGHLRDRTAVPAQQGDLAQQRCFCPAIWQRSIRSDQICHGTARCRSRHVIW